jgi:lipopolysaccharide export system protein LptA
MIAERQVEFKNSSGTLNGEKAVYYAKDQLMTVTGNPNWTMEQGVGKSDLLILYPNTREMRAQGHVWSKFSSAGAATLDLSLTSRTNSVTRTNTPIEITAEELYYKTNSAIYVNHVQVSYPDDASKGITCQIMATFFGGADNKLDQMIAEENVEIRQDDTRATGSRAVYSVPKGLIELTGDAASGNPKLTTPNRKFTAPLFVLDRINKTLRMRGDYRIEMETKSLRETLDEEKK